MVVGSSVGESKLNFVFAIFFFALAWTWRVKGKP